MRPLAVDLCCGLGGWASGLLAEGWDVVGFDVERHVYGKQQYPAQLVLQDIRTINGVRFRGLVSLIVASPPCTEYSYMAMPWKRGKQIARALRGEDEFPTHYKGSRTVLQLNEIFNSCLRIGEEAQCPIIIENVKGAQPWVGRARAMYGSFALWGDVPALMPPTSKAHKVAGFRFDGSGRSFQSASVEHTGHKTHGLNWSNRALRGQDFTRVAGQQVGLKTVGHINQRDGHSHARHLTNPAEHSGIKQAGLSGSAWFDDGATSKSSRSNARKIASAQIAKIPFPLAQWIARVYHPERKG